MNDWANGSHYHTSEMTSNELLQPLVKKTNQILQRLPCGMAGLIDEVEGKNRVAAFIVPLLPVTTHFMVMKSLTKELLIRFHPAFGNKRVAFKTVSPDGNTVLRP